MVLRRDARLGDIASVLPLALELAKKTDNPDLLLAFYLDMRPICICIGFRIYIRFACTVRMGHISMYDVHTWKEAGSESIKLANKN